MRKPISRSPRGRVVRAGIATAGVGAGGLVGATAGAAYMARRLVTPDLRRPDDVDILAVDVGRVTLGRTPETEVAGTYGVWFGAHGLDPITGAVTRAGHARVGAIRELGVETVTRDLRGVDAGRLGPGRGRWNMYAFTGSPDVALGLPTQHVAIRSDVGDLPTWLVPAKGAGAGASETAAVLVHGRGATRDEALRALPLLHRMGIDAIVPTYRNDAGAPSGPDGRYSLGLSEWRDVDAAMGWALDRGARRLVLVGWSMGGAIVLQALDLSGHAGAVAATVLDGPVTDWRSVILHHARMNRAPMWLARSATRLISSRGSRRLVGVHEPIDVARTDWVARAAELRHRLLLIHSTADEFVPCRASVELAAARPDLVSLELFDTARHCKEWNVDPDRWECAVQAHLQVACTPAES